MSKVRYSTNWMGPISLDWFRDRGLTKRVTKVLDKDSPISDKKKGDVVEFDEIVESYSAGRLDFWNPNDPESMYPDEMGVPPMRSEDWNTFSDWLHTFRSDGVLSLKEIVAEYEKTNPPIRWWVENDH